MTTDHADHALVWLERAMNRADHVDQQANALDLEEVIALGRLEAVIASTLLGEAHRADNAARADADQALRQRLVDQADRVAAGRYPDPADLDTAANLLAELAANMRRGRPDHVAGALDIEDLVDRLRGEARP